MLSLSTDNVAGAGANTTTTTTPAVTTPNETPVVTPTPIPNPTPVTDNPTPVKVVETPSVAEKKDCKYCTYYAISGLVIHGTLALFLLAAAVYFFRQSGKTNS